MMKFKTIASIFFISLISISCLNNEIEEPLIIDPIEILIGVWQEVEMKVDGEAGEEIMDGHKLVLWSTEPEYNDNLDNQINRANHYDYNTENLGISVNKWGSIRFENGLVKFYNLINGQSMATVTTLKYLHDEETLTLRDTTVTPPLEIKLIKIELD
ncbi:hypothetical protein ACFSKL_20270 [Belliella marina]|uniref:Lipocalin-like domain-containing protein n=1 Tax=Belliella marina TaxID=1644146 RepID=A0ABW4VSJ4_9BACT